jgi:RimJ/RimL family protein N-acetyltransferase
MELVTERLRLILESPEQVLARIDALSPAERAEVSPDWLARARAATKADPWLHGFSVTDRVTGAVVGACGFKGPPDADGVVEFAYGVDPAHQRRGYATEAARALIAFAFGGGLVRVVRAHTKSGNLASERILMKCGFERIDEVNDPEDGLVWRWDLREPSDEATQSATTVRYR